MSLKQKVARIRRPNWSAALCGGAYVFFMLLCPLYSFSQMLFTGMDLLPAMPLSWLMALCGVVMILFPLLFKRKLCLFAGLGCLVITGLCGLFGNTVLSLGDMERLGLDLGYKGFQVTHTMVDWGYFACLGCCLLFCLIEWHADWLHMKDKRFLDRHGNRIYRDRHGNAMPLQ